MASSTLSVKAFKTKTGELDVLSLSQRAEKRREHAPNGFYRSFSGSRADHSLQVHLEYESHDGQYTGDLRVHLHNTAEQPIHANLENTYAELKFRVFPFRRRSHSIRAKSGYDHCGGNAVWTVLLPGRLNGMGRMTECSVLAEKESPNARTFFQFMVLEAPADLPDGIYEVSFGGYSEKVQKLDGVWLHRIMNPPGTSEG